MATRLRDKPRRLKLTIVGVAALIVLAQLFFCWRWSREPPLYLDAATSEAPAVTGHATVDTLIRTVDWLLGKPGGYLSNDIYPPSVWLDNMPSFEFGVLVQSRDLARVLRNDYSRSQSQSTEHPALRLAEEALSYRPDQWIYPSTQRRLRDARDALGEYRAELVSLDAGDARFHARADNLREWLALVERRLGNLSQNLSASVGQTPWLELDDVFFEARGSAWALLQFMAAAQVDFDGVLRDRNAVVSLQQAVRELEGALGSISSPVILNGGGYGFFANHSLVLASYLSRAHSAVVDLRELLAPG